MAWKTEPENGGYSGVPFCLRQLERSVGIDWIFSLTGNEGN